MTQWLRGEDSYESWAASIIFAEVILLWRAFIRGQMKEVTTSGGRVVT